MAQAPKNGRASAISSARSPTRSACNRCHQQKLRCIKTKEQSSCERCVRLKTECRYRPRGRRNVPSSPGPGTWVEPRSLAPAIELAIPDLTEVPKDIGYDWLSFLNTETNNAEELAYLDSDPLSNQPPEPLNIGALDCHNREALDIVPIRQDTIHSPSGLYGFHNTPSWGLGRPLTSIVGRLTSLSMALYECADKLPSIKIVHAESSGTVNIPCAMNSNGREGALFALDEVFRVTNEFINVMKNPYSIPGNPETPTLTTASMTLTSHESDISSSMQPFTHLDEATMLLFLSCHCRLVEIYNSVFLAMRRCLEGSNATPHSTAGIILPQLQVGGSGGISSPALRVDFNGPLLPPATVSMYMTLITTLSSQLWAQVADGLRRKGYDGSGDQAPDHHLGPTWGIAMERTNNVERTIELVKRML